MLLSAICFSSSFLNSNGDLTIQDRPIMATMVNAINELNIKIQELSAEIDLLKGIAPIEPTDNNLE